MPLEQELDAGKLVKRNLGKILVAFVGGFLVFAVAVFVSIRYRNGPGIVKSSPVQVIREQVAVAESIPSAPVTQTGTPINDLSTEPTPPTGTAAVMGTALQDPPEKLKKKRGRVQKRSTAFTAKADSSNFEPPRTATEEPRVLAPATVVAQSVAPPAPEPIVIPADTALTVQLTEPLSTKDTHRGALFHGVLTSAVEATGRVVAPAGAAVAGTIIESKRAGLFGRHSVLSLNLTQITDENGRTLPIRTTQWYANGKRRILPPMGFRPHGDDASEEQPSGDSETASKGADISLPRGSKISFRLMKSLTLP